MIPKDQENKIVKRSFKLPRRYIFYGLSVLYLIGDIYWFGGPLKSRIDNRLKGNRVDAQELAIREEIVATVNAHPIRRYDLDRATEEYCRKNGISMGEISRSRVNAIRLLVLDQLVIDRLVWFHSHHYPVKLSEDEMNDALIRFRRGFHSSEEFEKETLLQGFSMSRIDTFLQNQFMQRAWIEKTVEKHIVVSEEEIKATYAKNLNSEIDTNWYEFNDSRVSKINESDIFISMMPERVNVRHIFLATLDQDPEQVFERVQRVYKKLKEGQSFDEMAMKFSEDSRNKNEGGNLGWLTRKRVPKDFYDKVSSIMVGKISTPFKTSLGWHIVHVIDRIGSTKASLDLMYDEIHANIETEKRQVAVEALINHIKSKAKIRYTGQFTWIE